MRSFVRGIVFFILFLPLFREQAYGLREDGIQLTETHVSFYCYRLGPDRNAEILILKRKTNRQIAPGEWECGGGQVREDEDFESAARRQLLEETGLKATHWRPLGCFEMKVGGKIIPGLGFSCRVPYDVDVKIDKREHSEYRWATLDTIKDIDFVSPKMKQTIIHLLISQSRAW
ncbi:MAG: NUDIX domain-containing protein [Opitutales bacterium]|nr:NUDIX domain-containing protein [Opitutales bacterium]